MESNGVFAAVTKQFGRSMGRNTMIPVETVDESRDIDLLNVVVKKTRRRFLFWQKALYDPHKIPLKNLLVCNDRSFILEQDMSHFVNYNRESSFSLSGKIGMNLMKEMMDVNLSASDTVTIKANLGDIVKTEVDTVKLLDFLEHRQVDIKHNFLNELREDSTLSLCVVSTIFKLAGDADISRKIAKGVEAGTKFKISESSSAEASAKIESDKQKQFGLYKGTVIAYKVSELKIDVNSGSIEPVLCRGRFGGFFSKISMKDGLDHIEVTTEEEEQLGPDPLGFIHDTLQPLLDLPTGTRDNLRSRLLQMMHTDLEHLVEILEGSENEILDPSYVEGILQPLLEITGLTFSEDGKLSRSDELDDMRTALLYICDSLLYLNEDQVDLLKSCKYETLKALLDLSKVLINGQPMTEVGVSYDVIKSDERGLALAKEMDLKFVETNVTIVRGSDEPSAVFEQIFWILYGLY